VSVLSTPVLSNDKVIGIFRVHAAEGYELSKEAITFIKEVADQVALAIQNVYLYEDAEEKHEILMADVWKWFRSDSDPFAPRFRSVETLPTMKWQD
jgi:K+-sensing histidine kinase KdpD